MPIVETNNYTLPHLVYEAPVNEKTQKLRDMFKIDESGYPEYYKWRGMARLGPKYNYEDPFNKLDPTTEDDLYSQKVYIVGAAILGGLAYHISTCLSSNRPFWTKLHWPLGIMIVGPVLGFYLQRKTVERQKKRFGIILDYARKHPERFGEVERPKYRECLYPWVPVR